MNAFFHALRVGSGALALLCFSQSALSSEPVTTKIVDELDYLFEIPVVSSATRLPQKLPTSPVSVSYIDKDMIAKSGATEIFQLLNLVPGYLAYYHSGNQFVVTNAEPTIEYAGSLEITIDGRSIYEPIFSAVFWNAQGISVADIEYIEVVRGTNSATYGSNAFLGAINIVTNSLSKRQGLSAQVTAGSIDTRNAQIDYRGSVGSLNYSAGVSYGHNSGFEATEGDDPIVIVRDNAETMSARLDILFTPSVQDSISVYSGIGKYHIDVPAENIEGANLGFRRRELQKNHQILRWERELRGADKLSVQFTHNRTRWSEYVNFGFISDFFGIPAALVPILFDGQPDQSISAGLQDDLSERYDLELTQNMQFGDSTRSIWGLAGRLDRMRSPYFFNTNATQEEWSYRLFGSAEHVMRPGLNLTMGGMLEHSEFVGSLFSPRASLNWNIGGHNLRLSAARGFRKPSLLELFQDSGIRFADGSFLDGDVIVDPNLDKARVTEFDLGYYGALLEERLLLDFRILHSAVRGATGESPTGRRGDPVFRSNHVDWDKTSFEAQIKYRPSENFLLSFQYAFVDTDNTYRQRDVITWIPAEHNASLLVSQKLFGMDFSTSLYFLSDTKWDRTSDGEILPSHLRVDARIARKFKTERGVFNAELIAHNIFNEYSEYRRLNEFEARVFLRLSFDFD